MESKNFISAETKRVIADYISKVLIESISLSQSFVKGSSGLITLPQYYSEVRRISNNPGQAAAFIKSLLGRVLINDSEIYELTNLMREFIEKYSHLEAAKSNSLSLFVDQSLDSLEESIRGSEEIQDSEKVRKIGIIKKWQLLAKTQNFIDSRVEPYCSFESDKSFAITTPSKGVVCKINLFGFEQKEDSSLDEILSKAIEWWANLLKESGCSDNEVIRFRSLLDLKLLPFLKQNGFVNLSTDDNLDQLLGDVLFQANINNVLPGGIEMIVTSNRIVLKPGYSEKAREML